MSREGGRRSMLEQMSPSPQKKPVIGLAGGIGSGKSLVARMLAEEGCGVIDADALARQVLQEPDVICTLVDWWGRDILNPDGSVNRGAVGRIVFANEQERKRLEGLVHPRVHAGRVRLRARYEEDPAIRAIVEDAPLLYEVGLDEQCDVVIFVAASPEKRLERVRRSRGWSEEELHRRESQQLPLDFKASRADYVIDNDGNELETKSHVRRVLSEIFHRIK